MFVFPCCLLLCVFSSYCCMALLSNRENYKITRSLCVRVTLGVVATTHKLQVVDCQYLGSLFSVSDLRSFILPWVAFILMLFCSWAEPSRTRVIKPVSSRAFGRHSGGFLRCGWLGIQNWPVALYLYARCNRTLSVWPQGWCCRLCAPPACWPPVSHQFSIQPGLSLLISMFVKITSIQLDLLISMFSKMITSEVLRN